MCGCARVWCPLLVFVNRKEVEGMFYHSYRGYMKHAFPADQLAPLSCRAYQRKGADYHLGDFSLSLVESLSTLAVLGDKDEFSAQIRWLQDNLSFDKYNGHLSLFEVNIRMLGGLLSAHMMAADSSLGLMPDYDGRLLQKALSLGYRLAPAFSTSSGIPNKRVNIATSEAIGYPLQNLAEVGTFLLEFSVLSRLTGDPVFENLAKRSTEELWRRRTPLSLLGSLLNTQSWDWTPDPQIASAGIGSGSDSYYEYLLKYYILSGNLTYWQWWDEAYSAIQKHMKHDSWYVDVDIYTGNPSRNWVDSFQAFFPSLMVLQGDITKAAEMFSTYHSLWRHYNFIPEVFTIPSMHLHLPNYPLRPEFVESAWYLYRATKDPYYLQVGEDIVNSLQQYCRTDCGFAAIGHVKQQSKEDQMDSFFLAETLKYLYLLFDEDNFVNTGNYIFNTEGHMFPVTEALQDDYLFVGGSINNNKHTAAGGEQLLPARRRTQTYNFQQTNHGRNEASKSEHQEAKSTHQSRRSSRNNKNKNKNNNNNNKNKDTNANTRNTQHHHYNNQQAQLFKLAKVLREESYLQCSTMSIQRNATYVWDLFEPDPPPLSVLSLKTYSANG
eukprot:TRINITY_DN1914_c1_g1_i1.p1 TRINITY_DN1914_c1_g1~~TRINITY_DN1914_c1_g1_i1.p1  ORF type:complete len:607 (+),score=80.30 TRINITY_DN1914_c1_g1_i1:134-1954(+)